VAFRSRAKVFWGTAIPFGIAMAIPRFGHFSAIYTLGTGVILGALFGASMVWLNDRGVRRLTAQGIDPGNMEPSQEKSVEVVGGVAAVHDACRRALLKLRKVRLTRDNPVTGELDAKTGFTWESFGESISVRIAGDGPNATVHVTSRPRLSTVTSDIYGKNVENVALFLRHLFSEIPEVAPNNRWRGP
jgi:hypothetical protein